MKLREVFINNFRNLVDVTVPIDDTTVLVGGNNSGKTAFIEALKLALTRRIIGRTKIFDEYDYYMSKVGDSPQTSQGIAIELWFWEDSPDEWPEAIVQALTEIIQIDTARNINCVGLRLSSIYDDIAKDFVVQIEFLNLNREPLGGKGALQANHHRFLNYIRLFYLSALRDSQNEFTPRSQFWGRILRDLKIDEAQIEQVREELSKLNENLLKADPRIDKVKSSLDNVQRIISPEMVDHVSIRALPIKYWELMSKSELIIKGHGSEVDFPLSCHGQGVQSLAVLFLFQAYIDVLLKPTFQPETEAILTLEEPEAHLHPQATRALAANLGQITSQKIISSHSPYFIQEVPFSQIRVFRRDGSASKVLYVKRTYSAKVPHEKPLLDFCKANKAKFVFDTITETLTLKGKMKKTEYHNLLKCYPKNKDTHAQLKKLWMESQSFLSNEELAALDTYAKRIRGEVLFARAWLLCEGQCEYLLIRYFAELLGIPLDNAGVAVIDFQNNGAPGVFVALARNFEIPWIMICDNDTKGKDFIKQVKRRVHPDEDISNLLRPLPQEDEDLELFLIRNGFAEEYSEILKEQGVPIDKKPGDPSFDDEITSKIRKKKTEYTMALIEKLRAKKADIGKVPQFFAEAIKDIIDEIR